MDQNHDFLQINYSYAHKLIGITIASLFQKHSLNACTTDITIYFHIQENVIELIDTF
jgi:hypothetical protein